MAADFVDSCDDIYLGNVINGGQFPNKLRVHCGFSKPSKSLIYVPLIHADRVIELYDEDNGIGRSICSKCNSSIDFNANFCQHCGAKLNKVNNYENSNEKQYV